jgi:hypothetical protein
MRLEAEIFADADNDWIECPVLPTGNHLTRNVAERGASFWGHPPALSLQHETLPARCMTVASSQQCAEAVLDARCGLASQSVRKSGICLHRGRRRIGILWRCKEISHVKRRRCIGHF